MTRATAARRLATALVATLGTLLATAAGAHAAAVIGVGQHPGLNAPVLQFVGDGVRDQVSIYYQQSAPSQMFEYSSGITPITAAAGCTPTSPTAGTCEGPIEYVLAFGEGGNDDITLSLCALGAGSGCGAVVPGIASGGPGDDILLGQVISAFESQLLPSYGFAGDDGNDRLEGASGADELQGDGGDDTLQARDGADVVNGGAGNDELSAEDSRNAGDTYTGGDGFDKITSSLDFSAGDAEVTVSLDGVANDGAAGEGDNVGADVERVDAYGRTVTLIGSDGPNELRSFGTSSTVRGLGGDDRLYGYDGADSIEGGEGSDHLEGGFGADVLDGGGGVDTFVGDSTERNVIATGNDTIRARDGLAEQVNCGVGSDSAIVDVADVVDPSCELVDRGSGPVCCVPPVKPGDPKVLGRLSIKKIASKGLAIQVACPAACTVTAELRVNKRTARKLRLGRSRVLARGRSTLPGAGNAKVTLKVVSKARRRFRRLRSTKVTLRTRTQMGASTTPASRSLRLKR